MIKNISNQVGGYSAALSVVPVGQPSISSVSVSGKMVTLTFSPNGSSLLSYDVIAIPSAITSGDRLFMTSSAQD